MKKLRIFISAIALHSALCLMHSQTTITPDDILQKLALSPEVQSKWSQYEYEKSLRNAQNSLQGIEFEADYLRGQNHQNKWSLGITQNFDWPGLYAARRDVAEQANLTAIFNIYAETSERRLEASKLLVQLMYCHKRIDMMNGILVHLHEIDASLETALRSGMVTILDKKKSGFEIANLKIAITELRESEMSLESELSGLIGTDIKSSDIDWDIIPSFFEVRDYDYYLSGLERIPDILVSHSMEKEAELSLREAQMSTLPGFGIGYRYEHEEGLNFHGFGISVTMPTWGVSKTRRAADMFVKATHTASETKERLARLSLDNDYRNVEKLRAELSELKAHSLDESYLTLLREARNGGELTVLDYLREQAYYRNIALQLLDLEERYALLITKLNISTEPLIRLY